MRQSLALGLFKPEPRLPQPAPLLFLPGDLGLDPSLDRPACFPSVAVPDHSGDWVISTDQASPSSTTSLSRMGPPFPVTAELHDPPSSSADELEEASALPSGTSNLVVHSGSIEELHSSKDGRLSQLRAVANSLLEDSSVSHVLIVPSLRDFANKLVSHTTTLKRLLGRCRRLFGSAPLHVLFPAFPADLSPEHRATLHDSAAFSKSKLLSGVTIHHAPAGTDAAGLKSLITRLLNEEA